DGGKRFVVELPVGVFLGRERGSQRADPMSVLGLGGEADLVPRRRLVREPHATTGFYGQIAQATVRRIRDVVPLRQVAPIQVPKGACLVERAFLPAHRPVEPQFVSNDRPAT